MLTNRRPRRLLRHLTSAVGFILGLIYAIAGLRALFVSSGGVADILLIASCFFVTLPASIAGTFAPRLAGATLIGAGALAIVGMATQGSESLPGLLFLYVGPSVLVGVGLITAYVRENAAMGTAATGRAQ
jgi:hypothetical protein